jgi:hypothetical protein
MIFAAIDELRHGAQNEKQAWQTPVLRRSDASEAEGTPGNSSDSPITTS